jgi:hypothetical protein
MSGVNLEKSEITIEGLSRLAGLELIDSFPDEIRAAHGRSVGSLNSLADGTVVLLALTLPIANAIARAIIRDKVTLRISRQAQDGSLEVTELSAVVHPDTRDAEQQRLIRKILAQNGADPNQDGDDGGSV